MGFAQSFSAFAALCTKASGKASREGPELSHLERGCLRCEFEGLNDWTTAANGFSLFREYIEKLLVMVEMRCHFRLFQLFPTGRQTVLVKARVVFKMARLRWRGRERERGKQTRMPGCACQAAVSTDLLNYALGRLEDILDPISAKVCFPSQCFSMFHINLLWSNEWRGAFITPMMFCKSCKNQRFWSRFFACSLSCELRCHHRTATCVIHARWQAATSL